MSCVVAELLLILGTAPQWGHLLSTTTRQWETPFNQRELLVEVSL